VFSDGGSNFQKLFSTGSSNFAVMASNASLWLSNDYDGNPVGKGCLVQIDHINYTSGAKFSRAMRCERMPKNKMDEDKCDTLEVKVSSPKRSFKKIYFILFADRIKYIE
jgi:hypothetical protein